MTTKTQQLLGLFDTNGDLLSSKIGVSMHDLQDTSIVSGNEITDEFLTFDGTNFIPQAISSFGLDDYATETYVDTQISNIINNASSAFDTFEEIATLIENNTAFAEQANAWLKRNKYRVYKGDGSRRIYGIHHYSGNVDVWLNGIKLLPKVIDFADTDGLNNLTSGEYDFISLGDSMDEPYTLNFTTSHTDPKYGIHWRTNFDKSQLLSKTNVNAYAIYNFNNKLPASLTTFLTTIGVGGSIRLQFSNTVSESDYFTLTGQDDTFSYVAQYLGFFNAQMPVPDGETTLPSYSSPYFSEGPIGQIGAPNNVTFYQLQEKNAQVECHAIEFVTAPSLNDTIIVRGY